ncbi:hypothetical protein [Streptomyces sp. CS113]|uniref:hypothetical protein n=1 Tax=Streptomyces sp. CS113 TaxID=1982761 RepID=UPI00211B0338|nr:hypothetical protein [Streptomyces sp. CS113]
MQLVTPLTKTHVSFVSDALGSCGRLRPSSRRVRFGQVADAGSDRSVRRKLLAKA